jgi:hypothetical protein
MYVRALSTIQFLSSYPFIDSRHCFKVSLIFLKFGAVAQLGEHQAGSLGVVGSIPTSSIIQNFGTGYISDEPVPKFFLVNFFHFKSSFRS